MNELLETCLLLKTHPGRPPYIYWSAVIGLRRLSQGSFATSLFSSSSGSASSSPSLGFPSLWVTLPY